MMRILTADEIRKAEKNAFQRYFTEYELMERAGMACAGEMIERYVNGRSCRRVVVVCGTGKNGGDGFVIARELKKSGCDILILLTEKEPEIEEPVKMFEQAKALGIPHRVFCADDDLAGFDLIVDCIFGIGFHSRPNALYEAVFNAVNASGAPVVSIDVPSGTNSTDGALEGAAVKAELTLAISTLKFAHVLPPSNACCGELKTVDIGIPEDCYSFLEHEISAITPTYVEALFPRRECNANKGNFGRLLSVCGSRSMTGAAVIAAKAAVRSGVGLLTCAFPESAYAALTAHLVDPLFLPLPENEEGMLSGACVTALVKAAEPCSAILIGCGIGRGKETAAVVSQLVHTARCPLIIDADGINALLGNIDILREAKYPAVLTPHPGEMARLIGRDVAEVQAHRIETARQFAETYGVIVVLKGANTVVASPKTVMVNTTGNPSMAKGGTGDMLAGMTASFIAQGMDLFEACAAAVFLHGRAGDICAGRLSQRGVTAMDMIDALPGLLSEIEK